MSRIIYLAQESVDEEDRGPRRTLAGFTQQADANRASDTVGRPNAPVLKVYDTFDEWRRDRDAEIRERVVSRLTPEERRVMGI